MVPVATKSMKKNVEVPVALEHDGLTLVADGRDPPSPEIREGRLNTHI